MVVDTSALVAILFDEPERDTLIRAVVEAADPLVSAATLVESSIVVHAKKGAPGVERLDQLIGAAGIRVVAVDTSHALIARDAFARFGKGQGSGANLNLGDCFSYALAKATGRPLLFKGDDFARTDLAAA